MPEKGDIPIESSDGNIELETQFILRLPALPAATLRSVVASGVLNLKDRLSIQLEPDMRHGSVRFDGWILPAKVVDLPAIIESLKTLDGKTFYKTADVCQMMVCKEEEDDEKTDGEESKKMKDGKDKKFQFPHGVTPPLKNVRKKRFRKTLKKKFFDVPEIEKEVKRLFRTDSEAIHVRYEVVNTDEENKDAKQGVQSAGPSGVTSNNSQSMDIVEHDLFGEVLSSSDEEDTRAQDTDEGSRLSLPPMREASSSQKEMPSTSDNNKYVTEFTPGMLTSQETRTNSNNNNMSYDMASESSSAAAAAVAALEEANEMRDSEMNSSANDDLVNKLNELESEIVTIREKRQIQEAEIADIENAALVSRFQDIINELKRQEMEKRRQYDEILMILNQQL